MAVVQIQMQKPDQARGSALFNLGFRPFFLGAGVFAVLSIAWWIFIYSTQRFAGITHVTPSQWHAHELLYGYAMAVVAGFLLTAVKNWTGVQTLHGRPLMVLFALWAMARVLLLFGTSLLAWAALADILFGLLLLIAVAYPIVSARQWRQFPVVVKVLLLWTGNLVFYLGCYGLLDGGMQYAINGAVFLFIALVLMIGRRVIPFFIERGIAHLVTDKVQLKQHKWLDISILVLFSAFFINEIFLHQARATPWLALVLFSLNGYRLCGWHVAALWRVPLLWSLYLSSWIINLGFLFYGLQSQLAIPAVLILHLFTIGGIGLMTIGMMSRVILGHTGRDIKETSLWLKPAFAAIAASVLFRVIAPLLAMEFYTGWLLISAFFWVAGFTLFLLIYAPMLYQPRVDGSYG